MKGNLLKIEKRWSALVCPPVSKERWKYVEIIYKILGQKAVSLHKLCDSRMAEILQNKICKIEDMKNLNFIFFFFCLCCIFLVLWLCSKFLSQRCRGRGGIVVGNWNCSQVCVNNRDPVTTQPFRICAWISPMSACCCKNSGFRRTKCWSWLRKLTMLRQSVVWGPFSSL